MPRSTVVTRAAVTAASSIALMVSVTTSAIGQSSAPQHRSWEFRVASGELVASGTPIKNAQLTAAQLSWVANRRIAVTGTFSWARSRDVATTGSPKLDVFMSDIGAEVRSNEWFADGPVSLSTFVGLGGGARSYNYRKIDAPATHNLAGYGSIGGEVGIGRVALRIEARDYTTGFKPLVGAGPSATRNDMVIMGALRFNRRPAAK